MLNKCLKNNTTVLHQNGTINTIFLIFFILNSIHTVCKGVEYISALLKKFLNLLKARLKSK